MAIDWRRLPAVVYSRTYSWDVEVPLLTQKLAVGTRRSSIRSSPSRISGWFLRMIVGLRRKRAVSSDIRGAPARAVTGRGGAAGGPTGLEESEIRTDARDAG